MIYTELVGPSVTMYFFFPAAKGSLTLRAPLAFHGLRAVVTPCNYSVVYVRAL